MPDFSRAASFRIAIFCALASVALLLALMAGIRFAATLAWRSDITDAILSEQQRLLETRERAGEEGLRALVGGVERADETEGFLYLLLDRNGNRIAGQLEPMRTFNGWARIVPAWVEEDEPFSALGQTLPDGSFLLVAHDTHQLHELIDLVTEGTTWILALILPLSLLTSLAVSGLILRRLEAINRVSVEIRSGNIHKRIPTSGSGDEFDHLAGHLNAMLDSIEDLTESLRQVSNEIAHQMRTPLTRIRGRLEAARREHRTADQLNELIESISAELDSLLAAFSAMLRISQLEAGASKQAFKSFDLTETLVSIAQDFGPIAEDADIALKSQIAPDLRFFGDRRLVIQMIVSLIENAIAHSGTGEISLTADRNGQGAQISVADKGIGIPADERGHVFKRFYRLDTRPGSLGFGLGLSLVAAVAKMHGIAVHLEDNQPGLKVNLQFSMPGRLAFPEPNASPTQPIASAQALPGQSL